MKLKFILFAIAGIALIALLAFKSWMTWLIVAAVLLVPIILLGLYDMFVSKHAITRNFPIVGRSRFAAEWLRPKLYQYFIEPDTDGRPFSRLHRNIIYQRAKDTNDTTPFGTQLNVYQEGYEWMNHSIGAKDFANINHDPRWTVGGKDCKQPYSLSIFNVSAMSFGSLSKNAVMALNGGAAIGNFAHNTGEGGISPYHDKFGGDLIYQIGTGYFGCRSKDGNFDPEEYKKRTAEPNVKMIELKLSQGAKPGHGGILPAKKATPEIAKIRGIEPYKDVNSPPYHKAFDSPKGLLKLIKQMQDLSGGKPVGFKLCVGHKSEFLAVCKAMIELDIYPDYSVGMPYREGLAFVYDALIGFDLKNRITLIASGKIASGFDIYRAISLGADACYSARAMMMAVGCIQALECNSNTCPTGVATQDESLVKGLVVADKKQRVANYHRETVHSFVELLAASGLESPDLVNRSHIYRRIIMNKSQRYDEIYPYIPKGCLLKQDTVPKDWEYIMGLATADSFAPRFQEVYTE